MRLIVWQCSFLSSVFIVNCRYVEIIVSQQMVYKIASMLSDEYVSSLWTIIELSIAYSKQQMILMCKRTFAVFIILGQIIGKLPIVLLCSYKE